MGTPAARHHEEQIQIHPLALWFGMVAGPALWGLQLLVDYYFSSLFCHQLFFGYRIGGVSWFSVGIVIMSAVAALVVLAAGLIAWRHWRRLGGEDQFESAGGIHARRGFMALMGVLSSALFLLLIVLSAVPVFVSSQCHTQ